MSCQFFPTIFDQVIFLYLAVNPVFFNCCLQSLWFGGSPLTINGECDCFDDFYWDDDEMECVDGTNWKGVCLIIFYTLIVVFSIAIVLWAVCSEC